MMNVKSHSDEMLLHALKDGSWQAFELLYLKYKGLLYIHAYKKLKDRELVMDIIHEIFLSLWEKRASLHIQTTLSAYLYQAVRYKVIDTFDRQNMASRYYDDLQCLMETSGEKADYRIREKMLTSLIEREIDDLPPRMREVFELSRKEYLTYAHIARKLDISEQSVRSHVKNALRILRSKLTSVCGIVFYFFNSL